MSSIIDKSSPLILFLGLLGVLSFSVAFKNVNLSESLYTLTDEQEKQLKKDIETITQKLNEKASSTTTPPPKTTTTPSTTTTAPSKEKTLDDTENWLKFWNGVANSSNPNAVFNSSNYISKTSIIPPVCPQCVIGGGVCTSCGGNGGAGTTSQYKNRFSDFLASYGSGYRGNGNWAGYGGRGPTFGQVVDNAGSGVVDVTKTALNNATGLAAGAGLGAIGLAAGAGSEAVGLARDAGSGAVGLLKDAGSGAKDLLEDAGSGAAALLKSNPLQINGQPNATNANSNTNTNTNTNNSVGQPNNPYQTGYYSQGTYNLPNNPLGIQGIDPYSYNGALVSKGSNYIPVTDDFSQFRK